jgi:predicted Ser/Thr protein kinase
VGHLQPSELEALRLDRLDAEARAIAMKHVASCGQCSKALDVSVGSASTQISGPDSRPLMLPTPTLVGRQVGVYRVLEPLGEGGMGTVYSAYHPELDRVVALKVLRPVGPSDSDQQARMMREAVAMAKLSHPNVVTLHDVGSFEGKVFLVMERVEGQTLADWLTAKERAPRDIVRRFFEAGKGLGAAHAAGLVHRDFKPANVLVSKRGRVMVTDFGLARAAGDTKELSTLSEGPAAMSSPLRTPVTRAGAIVGTPEYMAPEQLVGTAPDPRADQFAFCVSLYEALYHQRPYATLDAMLYKPVPVEPPRTRRVPRAVRRVLQKGLSLKPPERFESMQALLDELGNTSLATDLRVEARARVAQLRVAGVLLFLGLAVVLGRVMGLADWRADELPLAGYAAAAALVAAFIRKRRARAFLDFLGPVADCAAIGLLQGLTLPISPHPAGVAGWSLGLFVLIVVLSALPLRVSAVAVTVVAATVAEGALQREAAVGWGAVGASAIVLALAGAAMTWVILRMDHILAEWSRPADE